jgi:predicted RecB family nuclease
MKARGEGRSLTPTDVAHHLACQHRTQLERQYRAGELHVAFTPDARLQAMIQRGKEHERGYIDSLRAQGREVVDLSNWRNPAATLAAMQAGTDVIVQAPLGGDAFFGIADVLLRVANPSDLGLHSYEPVDTKLAAETKAGSLLQLLTYCELLHGMQGKVPAHFHVVTPDRPEHYRTADYDAYFRAIRDHLRSAATTTPPPATYPEPVPHCDVCAYWQHCDKQRRNDDHPSLIAGSSRSQVQELLRQDLPTLAAFAHAGNLPAPPERGRRDSYVRLAHQAKLQLQARMSGNVEVEHLPVEAGRGFHRLPVPSPGDVFLDFEGDPFVGAHGLEYLTGYGHFDGERFVYSQLWAFDHAAEKQALGGFLDFIRDRLDRHGELHVYHFGVYEVAALRRLCSRHDTHGDVLDELLRGERFVDLHRVVKEALRIGVESYGLKDLEKVIGFTRQLDLRVAGEARRDLELSLELKKGTITSELRQKVAAYNEDDCRATVALRTWLEVRRAEAVAAGAIITRPTARAVAATEPVREREARVRALRDALLRDLPPVADRRDEHRAKALLADLVGYFRREMKSAWWEHFRLRELPQEERMDEREILANLRFVGVDERQKGDRSLRCRYEFPAQETAIDPGDAVIVVRDDDPAQEGTGTRLGTVAELDLGSRQIVIKQGEKTESLRPGTIFRNQVVGTEALEDALLDFAESVISRGLNEVDPFASASRLLLRHPPRGSGEGCGPLQRPGESSVEATIRICRELSGGVLPVQGPPGTGKSYTGGHAIAELARTARVGITAVSHKVIDNLLESVREAAQKAGTPMRLLHKHDETPPTGIEYMKNGPAVLAAMQTGTVVGGTAWLWASHDATEPIDYLFVDEAGQMSLAQLLAIARCARNLVLLGDPQQLEQPQQGSHPDGAEVAALTYLIGPDRHTLADHQGLFLSDTWRLPPPLCSFTSELYYEGRLRPRAGNERQQLSGTGLIDGAGLFLLECAHTGNQASAPEEVAAIESLLRRILRPGATWTGRDGRSAALRPEDVLVIAPYNAQVSALRRTLQKLGVQRVGTVDKFQGQEAPVVIYSCTSSSAADAPRGLGFLYDPHRLNVATSRAQGAFVMVASPELFLPEARSPQQMLQANGMCRYRELAVPLHGRGPTP